MSELSPEARALIEEAAQGDTADAADRARVRNKLTATLGAAAFASGASAASVAKAATTAGPTATAATAATATGMGMGAKVLISAVVLGGISVGAANMTWQQAQAPQVGTPATTASQAVPPVAAPVAASATPAAPVPARHARPEARPPAAPETQAPVEAPEPTQAAVPRQGRAKKKKNRTAYASAAEPVAPAPPAGPKAGQALQIAPAVAAPALEAELQLIGAAQRALRAGDPRQALAHLEAHDARFPQGDLRLERQSVRALALCKLGRVAEGRKVAADVTRLAPDSPIASRVRRACQE